LLIWGTRANYAGCGPFSGLFRSRVGAGEQADVAMHNAADPIAIVIADDHGLFRDGLRLLLERESDLHVVGEAADGDQALDVVRVVKPDILLLDLCMRRRPGLEVLRAMAGSETSVRTILLTAAIDNAQVIEALQLGVHGIVLKDCATHLLYKSIRSVVAGEYWVGRERMGNLVQYLRSLTTRAGEDVRRPHFGLTSRELQVVSAIVAGYANREIAQQFSLSEDTVKHHLTNIFDKCGVSNRLELALFAVNHRLVDTT
jgi:DNA-binding NarL/FixJ family response regulator